MDDKGKQIQREKSPPKKTKSAFTRPHAPTLHTSTHPRDPLHSEHLKEELYLPSTRLLVSITDCLGLSGSSFYIQIYAEPEDSRATPTRKHLRTSQVYRGIITEPFVHEVELLYGEVLRIQVREAAPSNELMGEVCDERSVVEKRYLSYEYFTDPQWIASLAKKEGEVPKEEEKLPAGRRKGFWLPEKADKRRIKNLDAIGFENRKLVIALSTKKQRSSLTVSFYAQMPYSENFNTISTFYNEMLADLSDRDRKDLSANFLALITNRTKSKIESDDHFIARWEKEEEKARRREKENQNEASKTQNGNDEKIDNMIKQLIIEMKLESRKESSAVADMIENEIEISLPPQLKSKLTPEEVKGSLIKFFSEWKLLNEDPKAKKKRHRGLGAHRNEPDKEPEQEEVNKWEIEIETKNFLNFLLFIQKEKVTFALLQKLHELYSLPFFKKLDSSPLETTDFKDKDQRFYKFNWNMFWSYLYDPIENSIAKPLDIKMESFRFPLKEYWIDSSHNTYLPGDQLQSQTTTEMYRLALLRGCRCLELDIWSLNGELVVYHGYTLTKKVPLFDCLKAIEASAFIVSSLPVILSFELHIAKTDSHKLVTMLESVFMDKLQATDKLPYQGNPDEITPYNLRNKILIKTSVPKQNETAKPTTGSAEIATTGTNKLLPESTKEAKTTKVLVDKKGAVDANDEDNLEEDKKERSDWKNYLESGNVIGALKMANMPKNEIEAETRTANLSKYACVPAGSSLPYGVKSYSEKATIDPKEPSNRLIRIYPKGTRTDSSNYNPIPHWETGMQIVALNYQTNGFPMWINEGKFAQSQYLGYIKKPPKEELSKKNPVTVNIKVISGWRLPAPWKPQTEKESESLINMVLISGNPLPEILPQVEISLWSSATVAVEKVKLTNIPVDDTVKVFYTKILEDPFNPVFATEAPGKDMNPFFACTSSTLPNEGPDGEKYFSHTSENPLVDMVVFRVLDRNVTAKDKNDVIGYFAIRVEDMRTGFRVVPLRGDMGLPHIHASLLVHVDITPGEKKNVKKETVTKKQPEQTPEVVDKKKNVKKETTIKEEPGEAAGDVEKKNVKKETSTKKESTKKETVKEEPPEEKDPSQNPDSTSQDQYSVSQDPDSVSQDTDIEMKQKKNMLTK
eukprot:TRINITY_DN14796_c0_g1_i3.p1 TRINITY_DN14796_c0_g1~~TRINITY_DN14796_c0_g1_i3.p1  ORF type:complete len:1139 (-),score=320.72 TRINITY_DN14796_c0_g1_i3:41-3457(-)